MNVRHPWVAYIYFLSKIFFMIKWTYGFFILMWRNILRTSHEFHFHCFTEFTTWWEKLFTKLLLVHWYSTHHFQQLTWFFPDKKFRTEFGHNGLKYEKMERKMLKKTLAVTSFCNSHFSCHLNVIPKENSSSINKILRARIKFLHRPAIGITLATSVTL